MSETLTSHLEAINTMLSCVGSAPINSESGSLMADIIMAQNILAEVSRAVQSQGWLFNTEDEYPLARDVDGKIAVQANIMQLQIDRRSCGNTDPIQRGNVLYDRRNRTDVFTQDVKATVILYLPWESLPQAARRYIEVSASRVFVDRTLSDAATDQFTRTDELNALIKLQAADAETAQWNVFNNPETAAPLRRGL
jgi:hypothetical protein